MSTKNIFVFPVIIFTIIAIMFVVVFISALLVIQILLITVKKFLLSLLWLFLFSSQLFFPSVLLVVSPILLSVSLLFFCYQFYDYFFVTTIILPISIVTAVTNTFINVSAGLLVNILCAGDKSPVQEGFFKNSTGNLLPALRFLGGLYNFCNFVIILSLL